MSLNIDFIIELAEELAADIAYNAVYDSRKEAKSIASEYRRKIILDWFDGNSFAGNHISAGDTVKPKIKEGKGIIRFSIETYTDLDKVPTYESAKRWRKKYGGIESNVYVPDLSFNEGIIGLPQFAETYAKNHDGMKWSGPGWAFGLNINYNQKGINLTDWINTSEQWDECADKIKKIIESKIR